MLDYLLLLLIRLTEQPLGRTKIQKLLFLAEQGEIEIVDDFKPYKFGPWSSNVQEQINVAESYGYLHSDTDRRGNKTYWVSKAGEEYINERIPLSCDEYLPLLQIAKRYGGLSTETLVRMIYQQFPDWTERSTIRNKVNTIDKGTWDQSFKSASEYFAVPDDSFSELDSRNVGDVRVADHVLKERSKPDNTSDDMLDIINTINKEIDEFSLQFEGDNKVGDKDKRDEREGKSSDFVITTEDVFSLYLQEIVEEKSQVMLKILFEYSPEINKVMLDLFKDAEKVSRLVWDDKSCKREAISITSKLNDVLFQVIQHPKNKATHFLTEWIKERIEFLDLFM